MPKKISTNSKAVEARERKADAKKSATEKATKDAEDRLWQDDDKNLAKKKSKKEEEDRKKAEVLRKKAENKELLEKELASIRVNAKPSIQKVTQAQIQQEVEKRNKVIENLNAPKAQEPQVVKEAPIEENLNRLMAETTIATTVDEAISVLRVAGAEDGDKHPEKRLKAAYKAFETSNMARIKAENPSMRLSQWKQLLWREWGKSPENPLNQRD